MFQSGQEYVFRFGNGTYFTAEPNGTFRFNATAIGDWEKFRLNSEGGNLFSIHSTHDKVVCFDQGKHSFDVRDNVGDWEKWEFRPAGNGAYHMYCPSQNIYIHFDNSTARHVQDQHEASLVWITSPNQPQQQQQGFGNSSIQSGHEYVFRFGNGTYFTAEPNDTFRFNATAIGDWEKFRLNSEGNNLFSIRSVHNKVVCFDQGKHSFDTRDNVGDWEKWEFRPAGNGAYHVYCPGQNIYINFDNSTARHVQDQHQASLVWITSPNQPQQQQQQPQQQQHFQQQPQQRQQQSSFGQAANFQSGQEYTFRFPNGVYFTAEPNGTYRYNAHQVGDWEKFRLNSEGGNLYSIRTIHNKVVCFDQGKKIFETRDNVGDWEKFEFRPAGNGAFHVYNPSQNIYIAVNNGQPDDVNDQHQATPVTIARATQPQPQQNVHQAPAGDGDCCSIQ